MCSITRDRAPVAERAQGRINDPGIRVRWEDFEHMRDADLLTTGSADIRRRLTQARDGMDRIEAELWAI
jgi:hypothetical protein